MSKQKTLILALMPFFMILLTACPFGGRKECGDPDAENYHPDARIEDNGVCIYPTAQPQIDFALPEQGSHFQIGDTLTVDLAITHQTGIQNIRLDLVDYLTGYLMFDTILNVSDTTLSFNSYVINYTQQYRQLEFKLTLNDMDNQQFNLTYGDFIFNP